MILLRHILLTIGTLGTLTCVLIFFYALIPGELPDWVRKTFWVSVSAALFGIALSLLLPKIWS